MYIGWVYTRVYIGWGIYPGSREAYQAIYLPYPGSREAYQAIHHPMYTMGIPTMLPVVHPGYTHHAARCTL